MVDYSTYKFTCSCPDAAKKKTFNLKESSPPLVFDWSNTNAGAQQGICKHIWAVRILLGLVGKDVKSAGQKILSGELYDVPSDMPVPISSEEDNSNDFEKWQGGYAGHAFTPTVQGFSPPRFNFYRGA